ncbi:chromosome replication/partitioning protein [Borreliella bissettiae]|uniref:Plasmid partition family protein n=1 Tax=Borrelia bissettiae (strain DSM 17990 / CIP 109136 / DN127) TaxID=521010 RepID=G0ANR7_BORBD|nr:chromosome replication/partitioning protein [Borreliella bissettiae]AEL19343.1 plasmid partition family protein [Borreliella bissettiae DN127]
MFENRKKELILNNRKVSVNQFESNNDKDNQIEYESYKNQLRRITSSDINNKIELMEILYKIRIKKLYELDGYKKFEDFLKEFVIARSQAFLYLRLYKKVLSGDLKIEEIKQFGFNQAYKKIKKSDIDKNISKQNPIKPLRFQLKKQESYNFYKKNAKFTSFMMDEIFENQKDLINKLLKKYKELKG